MRILIKRAQLLDPDAHVTLAILKLGLGLGLEIGIGTGTGLQHQAPGKITKNGPDYLGMKSDIQALKPYLAFVRPYNVQSRCIISSHSHTFTMYLTLKRRLKGERVEG